jgi:hypothetical protein
MVEGASLLPSLRFVENRSHPTRAGKRQFTQCGVQDSGAEVLEVRQREA